MNRVKAFLAVIITITLVLSAFSCDRPQPNSLTLSLSVECTNAINSKGLPDEIRELLPEDGIIFAEQTVSFSEGESVYEILSREMKEAGIHMEASFTPGYGSAYIEGIANLYEFDCGELSGWMYKVNDIFPEYGCSSYYPQKDDIVKWVYTCDLGKDVGSEYIDKK